MAYFPGEPEGRRDSTLKGHTQNLTYSEILGRSNNVKGSDAPADPAEALGEA